MLVLASDLRITRAHDAPAMIGGPFALLLGASTDLGPSHRDDTQLTVELRDSAQPTQLVGWARGQGLSVRWQPGKNWAVVEGEADKVGSAFGVEVHDYRGQRGQLFYASPQQPSVPQELRPEVVELGRILSYIPHHTSKPPMPPLDVPDQGLQPSALRNTYNVGKLASDGFTGKGQTIVIFAFDGFDQADLDSFATLYKLPKFTPTVVGGQPAEPARRDHDGSRGRPRRRTRRKEGGHQRPANGRGRRRRLREDRAIAGVGRQAVPRRGVELLDRLGLRQADHRGGYGAGAVGPCDRTCQWHNGFQRQRRSRRPGVQGWPGLVVAAE